MQRDIEKSKKALSDSRNGLANIEVSNSNYSKRIHSAYKSTNPSTKESKLSN
jgi:hypothetical protein